MSSEAVIIIAVAVLLPTVAVIRLVFLSRWLERLNTGLPPEQQFHLIGWYGPSEHMRLWWRWREVRNQSNRIHPPWWVVAVMIPWAIGLVMQVYEWRTDTQIAARQQTTLGVITDHRPSQHNVYGYKFAVNGNAYKGWQSPRNDELAVGKQVTIYYDPKDPSRNALTDFYELSTQSLGPVPLLLLGIGAVVLFVGYKRHKNAAVLRARRA
jgi:opacity protein-like surface antigen